MGMTQRRVAAFDELVTQRGDQTLERQQGARMGGIEGLHRRIVVERSDCASQLLPDFPTRLPAPQPMPMMVAGCALRPRAPADSALVAGDEWR